MDERRDPFDVRLDALARELADLRRRLDRLEAQSGAAGPAAAEPAAAPAAELVAGPDAAGSPFAGGPAGAIALAGRTFVALGGAFLLRAATDAGYVPGAAGAMAGIVYATAWLVAGERAAAAGRRASAAVHGLTAVMIAYPLIWETTARFEMLPTVGAAAALVVFLALSLVLACRHALGAVASASVVFAALASLGLLVRTRDLPTFTVALLVVAAAVEGLALRDRWLALRWPAALALDLGIGAVLMVEEREGGVPEGYPVLSPEALAVIGLALAAVYLASLGLRTIRQGRPVTPFEIVQTPVALLLGLGLGTSAMVASGRSPAALGALALLLGAAAYVVSFTFLERRPEFGRNFYAYTTLGGALTLAGTRLATPAGAASVGWCLLALGASWLGARFRRTTLEFHAAVYLLAAAAGSDLLAHARDALLGAPDSAWTALSPAGALALGTAAVVDWILARAREPGRSRLPAAGVAATLGWSLAATCAGALGAILAGAPGPDADGAGLAAVRTAVLAATAVVMAGAARRWLRPELTWLAHATLAGGALKLLVEDLPRGRPMSLFVGFALYGGALVAVSRLMRTSEKR